MDKQLINCIQQELDGTISESDRTRLHQIMRRDPAYRQVYLEMEKMFQALSGLAWIEPPSEMQDQIIKQLPPPGRLETGSFPAPSLPVRFSPLLPLAAGIALGVLLYALLSQVLPRQHYPGVAGTMMAPAVASQLPQLDRQEVSGGQFEGSIQLRASTSEAIVEIELESRGTLPISLRFDESRVRFAGLTQNPTTISALTVTAGEIQIQAAGSVHTQFFFSGNQSRSTPQLTWSLSPSGPLTIQLNWP